MKIVLELDKKTPLRDGDLLIYDNGVLKTINRDTLLRSTRNEIGDLKVEISRLKQDIGKLTKVIKEITK